MPSSVRATQASYIVLPEHFLSQKNLFIGNHPKVLDFLVAHFDQIPAKVWHQRIEDGKVHWKDGSLIHLDTPFVARERVYYYREVEQEQLIPFEEQILYQDQQIIIAYKPHFLAVNPSGRYINECLVNRLRIKTGIESIVAAHRLDRATAGVMLLSLQAEARHDYHQLFKLGVIKKHYQALAKVTPEILNDLASGNTSLPLSWTVKNRMAKATPSFMMQVVDGEANTHSEIELVAIKEGVGLFELSPITGKTHQLRVHMAGLGMPILNDKLYPKLQDKSDDDFEHPLKLVAKRLCFTDPITGLKHDVQCHGFDGEFKYSLYRSSLDD